MMPSAHGMRIAEVLRGESAAAVLRGFACRALDGVFLVHTISLEPPLGIVAANGRFRPIGAKNELWRADHRREHLIRQVLEWKGAIRVVCPGAQLFRSGAAVPASVSECQFQPVTGN